MRSPHPLRHVFVCAFLASLVAVPASAYRVILKDGSTVQAEGKYRVENGKAIITLPNGTKSAIDLAKIDVAKTEEANRTGSSAGTVVVGPAPTTAPPPAATPPPASGLRDAASGNRVLQPGAPVERRPEPAPSRSGTGGGRTPGGYPDLATLPRRGFANVDLASSIQQALRDAGISGAELYAGSDGRRPLIELTVGSEAAVFQALEGLATALTALRTSQGDAVPAFEIFLATASQERAGQFLMTPELARDLAEGRLEPARYYVSQLQF